MRPRYDLFVSYPRVDAPRVRPLVDALRGAGLRVWLDETAVPAFSSITRGIVDGLALSRALLAWYSTSYPRSRACVWELTAAYLAAQREGDPLRRVLVLNPGSDSAHIHPVALRDGRFARPPEAGEEAALERLVADISRHLAPLESPLGGVKMLPDVRWWGMRPVGSERFVGRLEAMWRIHSALSAADAVAVTGVTPSSPVAILEGLGGVGKTFLAQEYALRFQAAYPGGIFWLRAYATDDSGGLINPEGLEAERVRQVRELAGSLGVAVDGRTAARVAADLGAALRERGERCLWVVDDLPAGLGHGSFASWVAPDPIARTLFTTRSREYRALGTPIRLGMLEPSESHELLTAARPPDGPAEEAAARELAEALGHHALALAVAGAALALAAGLTGYAGYLEALRKPDEDVLELAAQLRGALPTGHAKSITATLLRSIERLGDAGRDFLRLASVLGAAPIPARLVAACFSAIDDLPPAQAQRKTLLAVDEADSLCLSELIDQQLGARTVHSLVRRTVAFQSSARRRREALRDVAIDALIDFLTETTDIATHAALRYEVEHAREIAARPVTERMADLLGWVAHHDLMQGQARSASELYEQQLQARRRLYGERAPDTLQSCNNLASALQDLGQLDQARGIFETTLTALRQTLGDEDEMTLTCMNNLAQLLLGLGELKRGSELQREAAQALARKLGAEHPSALSAKGNLVGTLLRAGAVAEAAALCRETLEAMERVLGAQDPRTLTCRFNLAAVALDEGQLEQADAMYREVLEARRQVLGDEHPDTLASLAGLAHVCYQRGALPDALAYGEQVLAIRERVLGADHPDTLHSLVNLTPYLRALGETARARELGEAAARRLARELGDEHPETLRAKSNLGALLFEEGELEAARVLLEQVLGTRRRRLGDWHPDTLSAIDSLASVLSGLGEEERAIALSEEALEVLRSVRGEGHPQTLLTMQNLAVSKARQGAPAEACELLERALAGWPRAVPEHDPRPLACLQELASAREELGEVQAAFDCLRRLAEIQTEHLGQDHRRTLDALAAMGRLLYRSGNHSRARDLLVTVSNRRMKALGERDPATIAAMHAAAIAMYAAGEKDTAVAAAERAVELAREVLGPGTPVVQRYASDLERMRAAPDAPAAG